MPDSGGALTKLEVARRQLGTALWLYLEDLDPVSVHTLAGAASELAEALARDVGASPFIEHVLSVNPDMTPQRYYALARQHYNALKHLTNRDGAKRDDEALLSGFDDCHNDALLFIGWTDYMAAASSSPIEAQVFQVWFFASHPEKMARKDDADRSLSVFPGLKTLSRTHQKDELKNESFKVLGELVAEHGAELAAAKGNDESLASAIHNKMSAIAALVAKNIELATEKLSNRIDGISSNLEDVRRGAAKLEEEVHENEKHRSESMCAVFARERMSQLAEEIESDAAELSKKVLAGEELDAAAWDSWENVHHHWQGALKEWIDTARWYAPDVKKRIMTVNDEEYDGILLDEELFPSPRADRIRRFKKHYIILRHWRDARKEIEGGAAQVAFHGATEKEMHNGKYHQ